MHISHWLKSLRNQFRSVGPRVSKRRRNERLAPKNITSAVELLEERLLLVGPQLISIFPNAGVTQPEDTGGRLQQNEVLEVAPTEMVFRFSPGQVLDPASLQNGIQVFRSGFDDDFSNGGVPVEIGSVQIGSLPNEVVLRFAETLPDDKYQLLFRGAGPDPLRNTAGEAFNNGLDLSVFFEVDRGGQIEAVVHEPVVRAQILTVDDVTDLADGVTFTVQAGGKPITFEFDNDGVSGADGDNVFAIDISNLDPMDPLTQVYAARIADALADAAGVHGPAFGLVASPVAGAGNESSIEIAASESTAFSPSITTPRDAAGNAVTGLTIADGAIAQRENFINVYFNANDPLNAITSGMLVVPPAAEDGTFLINDGDQFTVGPSTFTMDSGPAGQFNVNFGTGAVIRDGDFIELDGQRYIFDTGRVLEVTAQSLMEMTIGGVFMITDNSSPGTVLTFEFTDGNAPTMPGAIAIDLAGADSRQEIVNRIVSTINTQSGFTVVAAASGTGRISLQNDTNLTVLAQDGLSAVGNYGATGGTRVAVEEFFTSEQLAKALSDAINGVNNRGYNGNLVNFPLATAITNASFANPGLFTNLESTGNSGAFGAIAYYAGDSAQDIADRIRFVLSLGEGLPLPSTVRSGVVAGGWVVELLSDGGRFSLPEESPFRTYSPTNPTTVESPAFYQLVGTDGTLRLPDQVTYNADAGVATLRFGSDSDPSTDLDPGTYTLRVGESFEATNSLSTTVNLGTRFGNTPTVINEFIGGDPTTNNLNPNDVDLYRFDVRTAGTVTIELETSNGLDGEVRLFDENGMEVVGVNGVYTITAGAYIVGVSSQGNDAYDPLTGENASGGTTTGSYRLTITPDVADVDGDDDNSSFDTATDLGNLGTEGQVVSAVIQPQSALFNLPLPLEPGGNDEPGHRDIPINGENHIADGGIGRGTDIAFPNGIPTIAYTFDMANPYGTDPQGNALFNDIKPEQQQRTREIFELYSLITGVQFVETESRAEAAAQGLGVFTIVTGDLRALDPTVPTGPGAVGGIAGGGLAIMDAGENFTPADNLYGAKWFQTAMHEIGHLLGLAHAYDLDAIMGAALSGEPVFPGDHDITHIRRLFRRDSNDVDMYKFEVTEAGTVTIETLAERFPLPEEASQLNSVIQLYRLETDGSRTLIAQNDDYYGNDSFLSLRLQRGTYFVGVSSVGNEDYDPSVSNSGSTGLTDGAYELRIDLRPDLEPIPDDPSTISPTEISAKGRSAIRDVDNSPQFDGGERKATAFDGDADGRAGGVHTFSFQVGDTIFVDKAADNYATGGSLGSITNPYREIDEALTAANALQTAHDAANDPTPVIVRILGNSGADGQLGTLGDNTAYEIGTNSDPVNRAELVDGGSLAVPRDINVVIDGGAVFKLQDANLDAGSSAQGIDRSGGSIQILGTTFNDVTFTSWHDDSIGGDSDGVFTLGANPGDWGGIVYRGDSDFDFEYAESQTQQNIFASNSPFDYTFTGFPTPATGARLTFLALGNFREPNENLLIQFIDSNGNVIDDAPSFTLFDNDGSDTLFEDIGADGTTITARLALSADEFNLVAKDGTLRLQVTASDAVDNINVIESLRVDLNVGTAQPVFLNTVNHATILFAGGPVVVDSISQDFDAIHVIDTRPTISFNTITRNASAAISANPDSFNDTFEDPRRFDHHLDRLGPDIHGNRIFDNQINGVRIRTFLANDLPLEKLEVSARLTSTDVVYVLTENLAIDGSPGGLIVDPGPDPDITSDDVITKRTPGRLRIDPGVVVKLAGARIEMERGGSNLIAEGLPDAPIVFTSINDDSIGAGRSFDTNNDGAGLTPAAGDWSSFMFNAASSGNFDYVQIRYAGGGSPIAGDFAGFNTVEIHQADVRISNSIFENNADGQSSGNRLGRGSNGDATIFVRGAQPTIVSNIFRNNEGHVISVNANAMQAVVYDDPGRSTGSIYTRPQFGSDDPNATTEYANNYGPLVRNNRLAGNEFNGMEVRGARLTTETVWDDTDIVHILRDEIIVPNLHTFGGLRLQSSARESLVVKLLGANAGFTASGSEADIDDRIGGTLEILGTPGRPVVLTSLFDSTVGAGFTPDGTPLLETVDPAAGLPAPGDWRSVKLDQFSNDRNVALYNELERPTRLDFDINNLPNISPNGPEPLGELASGLVDTDPLNVVPGPGPFRRATIEQIGNDNRPAGFEIHGFINTDDPTDQDVYSFIGTAGSEVWFDIDRTSGSLDTVLELIDATGKVLARSDNSQEEQLDPTLLDGIGLPMRKDDRLGEDFYSTNPKDAGMRVILPGTEGARNTYFIRVRSHGPSIETAADNQAGQADGQTSGEYQLQIRLRQRDEHPGSSVKLSQIRYATNGIEIFGQPGHSPLVGEAGEGSNTNNNSQGGADNLGNLLDSDSNTFGVAGNLSTRNDVDFYQFEITYQGLQQIPGVNDPASGDVSIGFPTVFDIDWADALARANSSLYIFNEQGQLVLIGNDSNIADDQPGPLDGNGLSDPSRGSVGKLDPFIGSIELPEGTYYAVVTANANMPDVLNQYVTANVSASIALTRLEPVDSINRIAEDHIGPAGAEAAFQGGMTFQPSDSLTILIDENSIVPWHLGDVTLFVSTGSSNTTYYTVDPFTGATETRLNNTGTLVRDIAIRRQVDRNNNNEYSGDLVAFQYNNSGLDNSNFLTIDSGNGATLDSQDDGIDTFTLNAQGNIVVDNHGLNFNALTYSDGPNGSGGLHPASQTQIYAVGTNFGDFADPSGATRNVLYRITLSGQGTSTTSANRNSTDAFASTAKTDVRERGLLDTTANGGTGGTITGVAVLDGRLYAITDVGGLFIINNPTGVGSASLAFVGTVEPGADFQGLSAGPQTVEDGKYSNMLFAITGDGQLYAFDTNGIQQPIFVNGATSVSTGRSNVTGLAFSNLDRNLWNVQDERDTDAGHGINPMFNESVHGTIRRNDGDWSLYFGNSYASGVGENSYGGLAGGAHGTVETNPFSLEGYSGDDLPMLYFNYFLESQNQNVLLDQLPTMLDSFRVHIWNSQAGRWEMLVTNNSSREPNPNLFRDEYDYQLPPGTAEDRYIQEAFNFGEGAGQWRQIRVNLSPYAGMSDLKLRFDFSSDGSMNLGDTNTTGTELRAKAGSRLQDGQSFIIDGVTFEFDLGFTVNVPSSAHLADGDTVTVTAPNGVPRTFVFGTDSGADIMFSPASTAEELAEQLTVFINGAGLPGVTAIRNGARVNITAGGAESAFNVEVNSATAARGLHLDPFDGAGVAFNNVPVVVNAAMTSEQVATVMRQAIEDVFDPIVVPNDFDVIQQYKDVVRVIGHDVFFGTTFTETERNDTIATADHLENAQFTLDANNNISLSTSRPHITIRGAGDGSFDYYSFDAEAGQTATFDIDQTNMAFDAQLFLYEADTGQLVATNNNHNLIDAGSTSLRDSFLQFTFTESKRYVLGVARSGSAGTLGGITGIPPQPGDVYTLHVSLQGQAVSHPVEIADSLQGDEFGRFFGSGSGAAGLDFRTATSRDLAGYNFEGLYIDDIIIGFAERGEIATQAQTGNSNFVANPSSLPEDIHVGNYQLEIRRGTEYVLLNAPLGPHDGFNTGPRDTNDRFSNGLTITIPDGSRLFDGQKFQLSDGVNTATFEFEDLDLKLGDPNFGVAEGTPDRPNFTVGFRATESSTVIAARLRSLLNSTAVRNHLDITAALAEGSVTGNAGASSEVSIFGDITASVNGSVDTGANSFGSPLALQPSDFSLRPNSNINDQNNVDISEVIPNVTLDRTGTGSFEYFSFTVNAGDTAIFDIDDANFDSELFLYDLAGNLLASNDDFVFPFGTDNGSNSILDAFLQFTFAEGGTYIIAVAEFNSTGSQGGVISGSAPDIGDSYTLHVAVENPGVVEEAPLVGAFNLNGILDMEISSQPASEFVFTGDRNLQRVQGSIQISENFIFDTLNVGILVDDNIRRAGTDQPLIGVPRQLPTPNDERLTRGVKISNNIIAHFGDAGIDLVGVASQGGAPNGAVPFHRIVNNTIYGGLTPTGDGVRARNVAPTLLNNIIANTGTSIDADAFTNGQIVVARTSYQNNGSNPILGVDVQQLFAGDPLFVDPSTNNFYLAAGAKPIDSARNQLQDRDSIVQVGASIGIPPSNMFAPEFDAFGQFRTNDENTPNTGEGNPPFVDRGAVEREDVSGPSVRLIAPEDNDGLGLDVDPDDTEVFLVNQVIRRFILGFDDVGIGIDDASINPNNLELTLGGTPLVEGQDYLFRYNTNTKQVSLDAVSGVFAFGDYGINLINQDGIRDLAGNNLLANRQPAGTTQFDITLSPPPDVTISDVTVTEGDSGQTIAEFVVSLSGPPQSPVTFNLQTFDLDQTLGAATGSDNATVDNPADYQSTSGSLTFMPFGSLSQTFSVVVFGDTELELDEMFGVRLTNPVDGSTLQAIGTINDDELLLELVPSIQQVDEGDAGTTDLTFTVNLINKSDRQLAADRPFDVTVGFETVDGTAIAGADYLAKMGTVTIPGDESSATFTVSVIGDEIQEVPALENFFVRLVNPVNAGLDPMGSGPVTATIRDDDPKFRVDNPIVVEGNSETRQMRFTVSVSSPPVSPVSIDFAVQSGTATAGDDFVPVPNGTLTFDPAFDPNLDGDNNPLTQQVVVNIVPDAIAEGNETFTLTLSNPSAGGIAPGEGVGTGTIIEDDPQITIDDVEVIEGNSGTTTATFTVTLSNPSPNDVSVDFSTSLGNGVTLPSAGRIFETEPNDTLATAETLSPNLFVTTPNPDINDRDGADISTAIPHVTILGRGDDSFDFFRFNGAAGSRAVFDIDGATFNSKLFLFDSAGNLIASNDDGFIRTAPDAGSTTSEDAFLELVLPTGGLFTVAVGRSDSIVTPDGLAAGASGLAIEAGDQYTLHVSIEGLVQGAINEIEGNDSIATAQNLDNAGFSLDPNPNINDSMLADVSTLIPHVTINGTGDGTFDYYSFTVGAGQRGIFDIDGASFDTRLFLFNSGGVLLTSIDDSQVDPGSTTPLDSFLEFNFVQAGTYFLVVGDVLSSAGPGGVVTGNPPAPGDTYTLNVAIEGHALGGGTGMSGPAVPDGSADPGSDFIATSGVLTIPAGETTGTITVEILGDTQNELAENFFVRLANAVGATIEDGTGQGTILNDDAPIISISDPVPTKEAGPLGNANVVTFVVSLSRPADFETTIDFTTVDGTAIAGQDFVANSGTLTFAAGEQVKTINVQLIKDGQLNEPNENFTLELSNPIGANFGDTSGTGTIVDNTGLVERVLSVTATDAGTEGLVRVFDSLDGSVRFELTPYPGFTGGVRVATGDINNDGTPDIVTAPGPGFSPLIKVFSGVDGSLLTQFHAYHPAFTGGVFVATGDFAEGVFTQGDSFDDIIVGPDVGGGPHVRVFSSATGAINNRQFEPNNIGNRLLFDFFAYNPFFTGGVRVAAGDVTGDGVDDLVVAAGPGGGPHIQVFDGLSRSTRAVRSFYAYAPQFTGGVYIAVADVDINSPSTGRGQEIITGAGAGGGPHVRVFNVISNVVVVSEFFAYAPFFTGGVRVAAGDLNGDTSLDIITSPGPGGGPHVRGFSGRALPNGVVANYFAYPGNFTGGVFVAGILDVDFGQPLLAAQTGSRPDAQVLTQHEAETAVQAAVDRLRAAGVSEAALDELGDVSVTVGDLAGGLLGLSTSTGIVLDVDAAGNGWFIDPTPALDEEFAPAGNQLAAVDATAANGTDLLTVVLHELGHKLGLDHLHSHLHPDALMSATLPVGTRRLPEADDLDDAFADDSLFDSLLLD